jgi:hypothetical protein
MGSDRTVEGRKKKTMMMVARRRRSAVDAAGVEGRKRRGRGEGDGCRGVLAEVAGGKQRQQQRQGGSGCGLAAA